MAEETITLPKNSSQFRGLSKTYHNGHDVWAKHPAHPPWVYWKSIRGEDLRWRSGWYVRAPINHQSVADAVAKYQAEKKKDPWKHRDEIRADRLEVGKLCKTWDEAIAWAKQRYGVTSFECVKLYGHEWFGSSDPAWLVTQPCTETIHGDGYSGGGGRMCSRPVVGYGHTNWNANDEPKLLCKMHLSHAKRREAAAAERAAVAAQRKEQKDENARKRKVAEDAVARLRGWGIKAEVGRPEAGSGYDPLVNGEMIVALVERFEMACREMGMDFDEEIADLTKGGRV